MVQAISTQILLHARYLKFPSTKSAVPPNITCIYSRICPKSVSAKMTQPSTIRIKL